MVTRAAVNKRRSSVADLVRRHGEQDVRDLFAAKHPTSQQEFLEALYRVLDQIIRDLEDDAEVMQHQREDAVSRDIVRQLRRANYRASSDPYVRGHVDILVESGDRRMRWLAESKIHRSYRNLEEGLRQLLSRYDSGRDRAGGLLIIFRRAGCEQILEAWRRRVQDRAIERARDTEDDSSARCFVSIHLHDAGGEYRVRHMGIHLYFAPRDASARRRAGDES